MTTLMLQPFEHYDPISLFQRPGAQLTNRGTPRIGGRNHPAKDRVGAVAILKPGQANDRLRKLAASQDRSRGRLGAWDYSGTMVRLVTGGNETYSPVKDRMQEHTDAAENAALMCLLCPVIVLVAQLGVLRHSTCAAKRSEGESQRRRRLRFGLLLRCRR
jgi:hypothetical protein